MTPKRKLLIDALLSEAEACRQLPHRTMFMCAYWSSLWNVAASARLREHGARRAVAGDIVVVADGGEGVGVLGGAGKRVGTRIVTQDEAAAGVYSVYDVHIPLPSKGVKMIWPGLSLSLSLSRSLSLALSLSLWLSLSPSRARSLALPQGVKMISIHGQATWPVQS